MTTRIPSTFYFLVLLTLVLVPNAHQVLCNHGDIFDRAMPVIRLDRFPLQNALGPQTTAFDSTGSGPYASVNNGRVLKWSGPHIGFVDFAVTSQNWSRQVCESSDIDLEPICGRPIGIEFNNKEGTLFIADAYYGLRSVGSHGGVATLLASSAEGVPFMFTGALDVDQQTEIVYFTDGSARFKLKDLEKAIHNRDMSGRLMKYDPATKQVTVLLRNIGLAAGTALSKDGKFVLVSDYLNSRILRYWLKGSKVNTSDIFISLPRGGPVNIRRNPNGKFWVAVSVGTLTDAIPFGVLLSENGRVLRTLNFGAANISTLITNVQEYNEKLYIGSLGLDYLGVTKTMYHEGR